jgi:hypothetical protein
MKDGKEKKHKIKHNCRTGRRNVEKEILKEE